MQRQGEDEMARQHQRLGAATLIVACVLLCASCRTGRMDCARRAAVQELLLSFDVQHRDDPGLAGNPHVIAYRHLSQIESQNLDKPLIYYAELDISRLSTVATDTTDELEISIHWSQYDFYTYELAVTIDDIRVAVLPMTSTSHGNSRQSKFERVLHDATFRIPTSTRTTLIDAIAIKQKITLYFVDETGFQASPAFPWSQLKGY